MNKALENYKLGQELFRQDMKYHQIKEHLGGSVNNEVYKGFESENRVTKGGYLLKPWNLNWGYKTSSDISTLF